MKNSLKRRIALILVLTQICCMLIGSASAEYGAETGARLGSVPIKDGIYYTVIDNNLMEQNEKPISDSYLIYDLSGSRITLSNFKYSVNDADRDALYLPEDVTIFLVGMNELANNGYALQGEEPETVKVSNGIQADDHNITFSGDGSLKVSAADGEDFVGYGIATTGRVVLAGDGLKVYVQGETAAWQNAPAVADGYQASVVAGENEGWSAEANSMDPWTYIGNDFAAMTVQVAGPSEEEIAAEQAAAEEAARVAAEQAAAEEAARVAAEQAAAEEAARVAAEQAAAEEAARVAAEQAAAEEAARVAAEQAAAEEAARVAAEQAAAEEAARVAAEQAAAEEAARVAAEQAAAEEAARLAAEQAAAEEAARLAAEQAAAEEAARLAAEQAAAEEAARLAAERAEEARLEAEAAAAMLQSGSVPMTLEEPPLADAYVTEMNGGTPVTFMSAPPSVGFEPTGDNTGVITGVAEGMKYRTGYIDISGKKFFEAAWTNVDDKQATEEKAEIKITPSATIQSYLIQVTEKTNTSDNEDEITTIEVVPQNSPSKCGTVSTQYASVNGASDGSITIVPNTTNSFVWYAEAEKTWKEIPVIDGKYILSGLSKGDYRIRTSEKVVEDPVTGEKSYYFASAEEIISIGIQQEPVQLKKPEVVFNATGYSSGVLTGFTVPEHAELRCSMVNSSDYSTWIKFDKDPTTINDVTSGTIYIVAVGDNVYTKTSEVQQIQIQRFATPTKDGVVAKGCTISTNDNGTIAVNYGADYPCEYKKSTDSAFTPVSDRFVTNLRPGNYDVRFMAKGNVLASDAITVSVGEYVPPKNIIETKITMSPANTLLTSTDSSATLTVTFDPANTTNQTVYWSSTNENVIRVHDSYKTTVGSNGVATASIIAVGTGTATIAAQTANGHVAYCDVTVQANYYFTYHKNGSWYYDVGGSYTVQTTGPASKLTAVKVNGQTVNPYYYTVTAASDGSTIVTISQTCMQALNHAVYQRLRLEYSDGGYAECYLHILSVRDKPITGDESQVGLWLGLMIMSATAGTLCIRRKKTDH